MTENSADLRSRMNFFKHPIHPIIVSFPIVFLASAFLTDLGYWQTGDLFWARVSFWLLSAGLAVGVLAALTGMVDFFAVPRASKYNAGCMHFFLNGIVLGLAALNVTLRLENIETYLIFLGLGLSGITTLILILASWYGGELTYRYKVGTFARRGDSVLDEA